METTFCIKEKTEKYKKYILPLRELHTSSCTTTETIILDDDTNIQFKFDIFFTWYTYYYLQFFDFVITPSNEKLKPNIIDFVKNNYFDKSAFDLFDDYDPINGIDYYEQFNPDLTDTL